MDRKLISPLLAAVELAATIIFDKIASFYDLDLIDEDPEPPGFEINARLKDGAYGEAFCWEYEVYDGDYFIKRYPTLKEATREAWKYYHLWTEDHD